MATVESKREGSQGSRIKLSKKKKVLFATVVVIVFLFVVEGLLRLLGAGAVPPVLQTGIGLYRRYTGTHQCWGYANQNAACYSRCYYRRSQMGRT